MLKKIPDVDFRVNLHKFNSDTMKPDYDAKGVSLKGEDEIYVQVNAKRFNDQYPLRVEMKHFNKAKDCSWWIIVGEESKNKVYAIKKTFFKRTLKRKFQVSVPEDCEKLSFYLVNDSYVGLDQVFSIDMTTYKTPSGRQTHDQSKRNQKKGDKKRSRKNNRKHK